MAHANHVAAMIAMFAGTALPGALPAAAAELFCQPVRICTASRGCRPTDDPETSIRIHDLDRKGATIRTHAEDVALTGTRRSNITTLRGTNRDGDAEKLVIYHGTMEFAYFITPRNADRGRYEAHGECGDS